MATLDDTDFSEIARHINANPGLKDTFKSWGISRLIWQTVFQAAEDWFVGAFNTTPVSSFKAALETAAGQALTAAQAIAIGKVWMQWRFKE